MHIPSVWDNYEVVTLKECIRRRMCSVLGCSCLHRFI